MYRIARREDILDRSMVSTPTTTTYAVEIYFFHSILFLNILAFLPAHSFP